MQKRNIVIMEDVVKIASYICCRYKKEYGYKIDEMKLHKLLYFTQRECIAQTGKPMFDATFYAWLYGPVLPDIRTLYKQDLLHDLPSDETIVKYLPVFDAIFKDLASTKSVMLSAISHGEISWKKARVGYRKFEESNVPMKLEDIYEDARRYKKRCVMLLLRH